MPIRGGGVGPEEDSQRLACDGLYATEEVQFAQACFLDSGFAPDERRRVAEGVLRMLVRAVLVLRAHADHAVFVHRLVAKCGGRRLGSERCRVVIVAPDDEVTGAGRRLKREAVLADAPRDVIDYSDASVRGTVARDFGLVGTTQANGVRHWARPRTVSRGSTCAVGR